MGKNHDINLTLDLCLAFSSSFLALIATVILFLTHPAENYERSIYDKFPIYFWIALISSISISLLVSILYVLKGGRIRRKFFIFILPILLMDCILFFLPLIHGYFSIGREDPLTNTGFIIDIVNNGTIGSVDIYPMDHILGFSISSILGINAIFLPVFLPEIFAIFFIIFMFLLIKNICSKRITVYLSLIFILIPIFGNNYFAYSPHPQSFLFMPFILFALWKAETVRNIEYVIIAIIICIALVFFHPLTTLIIILIFFLMIRVLPSKKISANNILRSANPRFPILIGIIIILFFSWEFYSLLFFNSAERIINWFSGGAISSELQSYIGILQYSNVSFGSLAQMVISNYGALVLITIASFTAIYYLFSQRIRRGIPMNEYDKFSSIGYILFLFFSILALFFSAYVIGYIRMYIVAALFSLILIPSVIGIVFERLVSIKKKQILKIFVVLLVVSLFITSIYSLIPSPNIKYENQQISGSEYQGMEAFFKFRNESIPTLEMGVSLQRFYDAIYGDSAERVNIIYGVMSKPIDHFGYDNGHEFGNRYNGSRYLIISNLGEHFYSYIYPEFSAEWRFTPADFEKLYSDVTVDNIFSNGDIVVLRTYDA